MSSGTDEEQGDKPLDHDEEVKDSDTDEGQEEKRVAPETRGLRGAIKFSESEFVVIQRQIRHDISLLEHVDSDLAALFRTSAWTHPLLSYSESFERYSIDIRNIIEHLILVSMEIERIGRFLGEADNAISHSPTQEKPKPKQKPPAGPTQVVRKRESDPED